MFVAHTTGRSGQKDATASIPGRRGDVIVIRI
jgi:hypothetical protein